METKSSYPDIFADNGGNRNQLTTCEGKYQIIFNNSLDALLLETIDGRIVDCNEYACILHGYSREEMLKLEVYELSPGIGKDEMFKIMHELALMPNTFVWVSCRHKDGHTFLARGNLRPINIGGQPMYLGCIRDAFHPSAKEPPLPDGWESQHIPIGSITWRHYDGDFKMVGFNSSAADIVNGIIHYMGRSINYIFEAHPDIIEDFRKCYEDKLVFMRRAQNKMPFSGKTNFISITYVYLTTEVVISHIEEINDKDVWHTHYQRIPLPSLTCRKQHGDFILLECNIAAIDFMNGGISRYIGKPVNRLFKNPPGFMNSLIRCANGEDIGKLETTYRKNKQESIRHILCQFNKVQPDLILIYIEDITGRRNAEKNLQMSRKHLYAISSQLLTAEERERKRIAKELHDSLGQSLTAIKFIIETAIARMPSEGTSYEHLELLKSSIPIIQKSVEEMRMIATAIRPPMLEDMGLLKTISWFCSQFAGIYSSIFVHNDTLIDEKDIPDFLKITIFRILQEALNNVAKHSRADHVYVNLKKVNESIVLTIEDNGMGFDKKANLKNKIQKSGLGLDSMKDRIKLSGGVMTLKSQMGKGTFIRAIWPL